MADPQGAMLGNAHGYVDIDISGVERNLNQAKGQFNNFINQTGSMMQSWGNQIASFGQNLTLWTAPVALAVGTGLNVAADFDSVLTEIQARTGLTAEAMEQVRQTALQLGADTAFSSQQAADAFLNLLTAGLSVEDALSTLPQVLTAAAAGGMDLGTAADLTTSIMASFNLTAQDSTAIIDAMSRASAASPASMSEIGIAMKDVGGLAQMFNLSLDETAAVLAIFAQNGIRGAEAGTQLRSLLLNLSSPTAATQKAWDALGTSLYNADGTMRNLDDVLADIRVGLAALPVEQQNEIISQLAGSYGIVGFNALLASDGIEAMQTTMAEQASAAEVAAAMMDTFKMTIDSLMGTIETFWITVLTPFMNNVLKPLANEAINVVNAMTAWAAANEPLVQTIMSVVAGVLALGPTLFVVGRAIQLIGFLLAAVSSPIALVTAGVAGLVYLFRDQLATALRIGVQAFSMFQAQFAATGDLVGSVIAGIQQFVFGLGFSMGMSVDSALAMAGGFTRAFNSIRNIVTNVFNTVQRVFGTFFALLAAGVPVLEALKTTITAVFGTLDWLQIGADILAGLGAGLSAIGSWVNDNLITPLTGAFSAVDWAGIGNSILHGIGIALSTASDWVNFATDNFLTPFFTNIQSVLGTINWQRIGQDIVNFIFGGFSGSNDGVGWGKVFTGWMDAIAGAGAAVFDFLGWVGTNVILPLWDGIMNGLSKVDWGAIGSTLMNLLGTALGVLWNAATWAWDNLISPMINSIGTALSQVDWMQLGLDILNALGAGLMTLWGAATWAYDNLLIPLVQNAVTAITQIDWFGVGEGIVNAIGTSLKNTFDFIAWIIDNIFNPMTSSSEGATGQIDWFHMGSQILGAIGQSLINTFNFIIWLKDNVFGPMLTGAGQAIREFDWASVGQNLMDAIKNALPNIGQWVEDWIIRPIAAALSGFNPMANINTTTQLGGGGYQAQVQSTVSNAAAGVMGQIGGFAGGINYVPNDMIALIHRGERIERANENPYNPNAQTSGMGNISFEGAQFNFPNVRSREEAVDAGMGLAEGIMKRMRNSGVEETL